MTNSIDTMPAGPELDALVAETVMGWPLFRGPSNVLPCVEHDGNGLRVYGPGADVFCPSTSIAAAWLVVEKMAAEKRWMGMYGPGKPAPKRTELVRQVWLVRFVDDELTAADTAPLAICRAALKSVRARKAK
jgi:hypothetical protein